MFNKSCNVESLISKKVFPIFSVTILIAVISYSLYYRFVFDAPLSDATLMNQDISAIVEVLNSIDKECNILAIKAGRSPIDFLTVGTFAGSEVGPLELAYPKKWKGPYMKDNPTRQGAFYDLISSKGGHYVIPGANMRLPGGSIVGKDFVITQETNLDQFIEHNLKYKNVYLGRKLSFRVGDWDYPGKSRKILEKFNKVVREVGEALPYTLNEQEIAAS